MKEIISKDSEKVIYKENNIIYIYERATGCILNISSYKYNEVCTTKPDGTKSYDTSWSNKLDWFPEDEQEKVRQAKADHDFYCRHGYNNPAKHHVTDISTKNTDIAAAINNFVSKTVEQSIKNIDISGDGNSIINDSNNNYIIANGKHYKKPTGGCSVSIVNGTVKINGKKAVAIEDKNSFSDTYTTGYTVEDKYNTPAEGYAVDNSRFPADASCPNPIDENEEIILFDTVTYDGHKIPKCPGMICNSSGEVINIIETKDSLFCNGYEFKNGKWIKTFKAKLKTLFK